MDRKTVTFTVRVNRPYHRLRVKPSVPGAGWGRVRDLGGRGLRLTGLCRLRLAVVRVERSGSLRLEPLQMRAHLATNTILYTPNLIDGTNNCIMCRGETKRGLGKSRTRSLQSPPVWVLMVDPVSRLEFGLVHESLLPLAVLVKDYLVFRMHRVCNLEYNYSRCIPDSH